MNTSICSKNPVFTVSSEIISVPIDYSDNIQKMVDAGNYDRTALLIFLKDQGITPKYSIGVRDYHLKLLTIHGYFTTKQVQIFIEQVSPSRSWKPGRIEHLLALGAVTSKAEIESSIFALGTEIILSDGTNFPRLENLFGEKGLSILGTHEDSVWSPFHQFVIYRES